MQQRYYEFAGDAPGVLGSLATESPSET